MNERDDICAPNPLTCRFNLPDAARPDSMDTSRIMDDGRAAAREAEVCQKIEIEIAFRNRLVAALDKEGYIVKGGMTPEKQEREFLRKNYENEPAQTSSLWSLFFVHSKDESAAFCLSVWFSSDEPSPKSCKWRPLHCDGMSVAGPSKRIKWSGFSFCDNTPPLCYHLSIIDQLLRFKALPSPVMQATLLDGHLAEELASKVAVAFERISAILADDRENAVDWWMRSRSQGYCESPGLVDLELSWCLALGVGVDQFERYDDKRECVYSAEEFLSWADANIPTREPIVVDEDSWWYRYVKKGDAQALYWLGMCYIHVKQLVPPGGNDKDVCTLDCLRKAAEKGHVEAQHAVAWFLCHGPRSVRDQDEGIRWYRLAAAQGHPNSREQLREIELRAQVVENGSGNQVAYMTQNRDIRISDQSISRSDLLCKTIRYVRARSRIIGDLISFKSRDGRFVFLEGLLDYLTETRGVAGLECFRMEMDTCLNTDTYLNNVKNTRAACNAHWTFGDVEQWESDQCCGILALHNTNWTAGKRIPITDIVRWAISDRINRLLVLCLPPEDFVAPYEQTWEAVCEEVPWAPVRDTSIRRRVRRPGQDGSDWKVLEPLGAMEGGNHEFEIDERSSMGVVRKRVLAPQVTERYVRLSYLGDVLPWLREKVLPVAEAEDAGLAQTVAQCIAHIELRPALSAGDGGAAIREDEILQRIEIESAFQARLVAALDKEGYFVTKIETMEEQGCVSIREKYEHEPDHTLRSWRCFRVHSKDASALFWLTVWLSSDKSSLPQSFSSSEWRTLGGDDRSVSGPSKPKELNSVSFIGSTLPLCCHLLIIDARLRFETLPLPAMRDTLLGGHLAEELASKVAVAFDRIRAICADKGRDMDHH